MTAAGTKEVLFNVFEGLVKPTSDGDIVPAVASAVEKSEDGLTYTFTLRQDVKFHSGDPVTLRDVIFSIERRMNGEDAAAKLDALDIISGLEVNDNGTAKRIGVTLGQRFDEKVEIISDELEEGMELVVTGQDRLVDGVKVKSVTSPSKENKE